MLDKGRLARTCVADNAHKLSLLDLKVNIIYRSLFKGRALTVGVGKFFGSDNSHFCLRFGYISLWG